jgi:hypothetical protein
MVCVLPVRIGQAPRYPPQRVPSPAREMRQRRVSPNRRANGSASRFPAHHAARHEARLAAGKPHEMRLRYREKAACGGGGGTGAE